MAWSMQIDGMTEINEMLSQMEQQASEVAAKALYIGAGIMADEIRKEAGNIKTGQGADRESARYATEEEKQIVLEAAAGIAKFRKSDDSVDTSVGFRNAGYAELHGRSVPIPKIVNAINSGTSFMHKQPFIRKAKNSGGKKATKAMQEAIEAEFEAVIKNTGGK